MSEVIITAAAWVRDEPKVTQFQAEQATVSWRILAEASVTDTAGEPVSKVQKSAWRLHVTDSSGNTYPLGFSVSEIAIIQPTQLGFYLLRLDELKTSDWPAAPTACGIAIKRLRRTEEAEGAGTGCGPDRACRANSGSIAHYGRFLDFKTTRFSVIRVYDEAGNVIDTHEHKGEFQGVVGLDSFTDCSVPLVVRLVSIARENYTRR
jgi:hypothetical protein